MLTYLMVARLATLCPTAVLQRLDRLVEPLRTTCTARVKANAVKQEYEMQNELKVGKEEKKKNHIFLTLIFLLLSQ